MGGGGEEGSKNHCHLKYVPRPEKTGGNQALFEEVFLSQCLYYSQPLSHRTINAFNMLWVIKLNKPYWRRWYIMDCELPESLGKKNNWKRRNNECNYQGFVVLLFHLPLSYSQEQNSMKEQQRAFVSSACLFCTSGVPTSIYRLAKPGALNGAALHWHLSRRKPRLCLI